MHWVDRGLEPAGLARIRTAYTSSWVEYYSNRVGIKPTDTHWRKFNVDLCRVFGGICGYCEAITKGEVDHFRPKSKFPKLVYSWTNWVFVCHECNQAKLNKWPVVGYVDPCATCKSDRPERYFIFDTLTGMILADQDLDPVRRQRALRTIDDLGLNDLPHLRKRVWELKLFSAALSSDPHLSKTSTRRIVLRYASGKVQFSSIVRAWLTENGYQVENFEESATTYG